jgi:predicted Zn-dependent protease
MPETTLPGGTDEPAAGTTETDEEESTVRSTDELIDALSHRSQVDRLVDPRMRTRVAELTGQAEAAMREKDYFRAEDRFDLALKLNPGNPLLEGGRANAQIGAGLYRSAAVTLVGLFRKHEAMIDVGYDADLLPSRTRLRLAAQTIEGIVAKDPEGSSGMGVVVAYIGRQLGDRRMIQEGLDSIDDPRLTSLVPQLRRVWLAEKAIPGIDDIVTE